MYAVKAVTHEGKTIVLRKGFLTKEDAEDYPVKLSNWLEVYVEPYRIKAAPDQGPPPEPWDVIWTERGAYIVDANGFKIAQIFGGMQKRIHTVTMILDAFGGQVSGKIAKADA